MKIAFNRKPGPASAANMSDGRHIGVVTQIVGLGDQPGFNFDDPPSPSVGVVVKLANTEVARRMRISDSPYSAVFGFLEAALPDPSYEGDDPLPLALGRPVAVEIRMKGKFASVESFHRPEDFELAEAPKVGADDLLYLDGVESLQGETGKTMFQRLNREIRTWISKRVRA